MRKVGHRYNRTHEQANTETMGHGDSSTWGQWGKYIKKSIFEVVRKFSIK